VRRTEITQARSTAQERGRRAAPVGIFGPEIAEARAIKRATRAAFGQDIPDESDLEGYQVIEHTPEQRAINAATYDRIYGEDEAHAFAELPPTEHGSQEVPETDASTAEDTPQPSF